MRHDMESIRAELARISDALTRIEGQLADLLGADDPYSRRVNLAHAERVSRYLERVRDRHGGAAQFEVVHLAPPVPRARLT